MTTADSIRPVRAAVHNSNALHAHLADLQTGSTRPPGDTSRGSKPREAELTTHQKINTAIAVAAFVFLTAIVIGLV